MHDYVYLHISIDIQHINVYIHFFYGVNFYRCPAKNPGEPFQDFIQCLKFRRLRKQCHQDTGKGPRNFGASRTEIQGPTCRQPGQLVVPSPWAVPSGAPWRWWSFGVEDSGNKELFQKVFRKCFLDLTNEDPCILYIYTYICHKNQANFQVNIPYTWIVWVKVGGSLLCKDFRLEGGNQTLLRKLACFTEKLSCIIWMFPKIGLPPNHPF